MAGAVRQALLAEGRRSGAAAAPPECTRDRHSGGDITQPRRARAGSLRDAELTAGAGEQTLGRGDTGPGAREKRLREDEFMNPGSDTCPITPGQRTG